MSLQELPQDCIATIIAHTSPWDACRLACVNRTLAATVRSDTVWNMLLPSDYALHCPDALQRGTKREIVEALAEGVYVANGKQRYVLLRRSGGVCRFLSAADMSIAWGDDTRFWRWEYSRSSCFSKVAHLLAVCWLEVTGVWKCTVPPGTYSIIWRLKIANPQGGCLRYLSWKKPLSFAVSVNDKSFEKELDFWQVQSNVFEEWFEFEVGQIVVRGERMKAQELELLFSIKELDCSYWKGGLFLDCLALRPSITEDEPIFFRRAERESSKRRVRPGVF